MFGSAFAFGRSSAYTQDEGGLNCVAYCWIDRQAGRLVDDGGQGGPGMAGEAGRVVHLQKRPRTAGSISVSFCCSASDRGTGREQKGRHHHYIIVAMRRFSSQPCLSRLGWCSQGDAPRLSPLQRAVCHVVDTRPWPAASETVFLAAHQE